MTFSNEWEQTYKKNQHNSIWPWSDLVSYVMRYCKPFSSQYTVLDLGCGAGANIPFFKSLGVQYYGIDGSQSVIKMLQLKYPELKDRLVVGDFTKKLSFKEKFDLVVDRASLTHNTTDVIANCADKLILPILKKQGKFIGIDWFSVKHSDYIRGIKLKDDPFSIGNYTDGQFAGLGIVHFTDKELLEKIFINFNIKILEHKIYQREIPDQHTFAS
ncbi:MAG: class I SAM-dependent methyltransferase [Patescibacteria group bacterium]|jgi:SAM-dependent methyltransferase